VRRPDPLLRRAWRLPFAEKLLAIEACIALTAACTAIRCAPRRSLRRILRDVPSSRPGMWLRLSPDDVLRMVDRVAHVHPFRPQCLERALAGRRMLARRGRASTLVIAARPPARPEPSRGLFEAHAWLELDGRIAPAADVTSFQPLWRSP
jgi:hypothetical protein